MSTSQAHCDNWDQHWKDFSAGAEAGPTTRWRCGLIFRLLGIDPVDRAVRMLEIGSGRGEFADRFCADLPRAEFLGVELSQTGVQLARRRVPAARFVQRDLLKPSTPDESLEFRATHAICSEVLEHVDEPGLLLRGATDYMGPDCRVIITVPGGPLNAFYTHIGHRRHYGPVALKKLLEGCGFDVETCYGVGFPFYNLFRLMLTWRGETLIQDVSGPPSFLVRLGAAVFDTLFRLNFGRWGWQTVAVARYRP